MNAEDLICARNDLIMHMAPTVYKYTTVQQMDNLLLDTIVEVKQLERIAQSLRQMVDWLERGDMDHNPATRELFHEEITNARNLLKGYLATHEMPSLR